MLNLKVQPITNDGGSLNHNQSSDHSVIDFSNVPIDDLVHSESKKMGRIKCALLLWSFILEGLSLAFDQLSTPKEPIYALMSTITASLGLLISIIELSYRVRENYKTIWRLLGDALDNFGFFVSTWQFIYALLQYAYIYKKKINNPIKISLLPLILLISVTISKLYNYICAETIESSMDASRTTTSSKDGGPVSLSNAGEIETRPVVPDEPEVLIPSKKSRDDMGIHKRAIASRKKIKEKIQVALLVQKQAEYFIKISGEQQRLSGVLAEAPPSGASAPLPGDSCPESDNKTDPATPAPTSESPLKDKAAKERAPGKTISLDEPLTPDSGCNVGSPAESH